MTHQQLWQAALGELEVMLSKAQFSTWFQQTFIISYENERVIIGVPNIFTKSWFEKRFNTIILKALRNVAGAPIKEVICKVDVIRAGGSQMASMSFRTDTMSSAPASTAMAPSFQMPETHSAPVQTTVHGLNPKYTFQNFIVGKYCELANAACLAVAAAPGEVYNPLFLYGQVGLGKTHLLQAVGHEILRRFPDKKVLFVTSEKFTNDYIQAVRSGRGKEVKDIYRSVDVLLIDDIQFLSSKEGTQEEFFHTFNALHQTQRQLVIASDRPPKAIPAIEGRLLSRLEWGMIADITTPDLETRIAILETKCKEKNIKMEYEILNCIATMVHSNIRELEGALNRIHATSQLQQGGVSLAKVKQMLSAISNNYAKKSLSPKQLIQTVTEFYSITLEDILGDCRKKELTLPRQIIMYLLREEIKCSYPLIGAELGGRDHTTAIHAYNKISKEIENSPKIKQDIDLIRQRIYNI